MNEEKQYEPPADRFVQLLKMYDWNDAVDILKGEQAKADKGREHKAR